VSHDFWVTISADSERGRRWERLLGTRTVPVRSPVPHAADLPGLGVRPVFDLAHERLAPAQLDALLEDLCARFGLTRAEGDALLAAQGIPILDEGCTVTIEHPERWLGG
jgi:hypothetical protein